MSALLIASAAGAQVQTTDQPVGETRHLLRPGDVVRVKIWREPDLSGDFEVNEHGHVVLPKLGKVSVADIRADSIEQMLGSMYNRYLRNPSVEIRLLRRVTVLGAVRNPGLYQVDHTLTIADVLAMASGVTPDGRNDRIELIRDGERIATVSSATTRIADSPIRSGDQLFVPQRSWLSRNAGVVAAGITALGVLMATLAR